MNDSRTVEKLELEWRYWQQKEVPWYLVTEREINAVAKENIDWLYVLKGLGSPIANSLLELTYSKLLWRHRRGLGTFS